jgi:hypothetical protein
MGAPGPVVTGAGGASLGYQQISAATLAAATGLTIPTGASIAVVRVDTAPVRWRDDGTAPTAAIGMQMLSTDPPFMFDNLASLKFILASGSPVLNVSYY